MSAGLLVLACNGCTSPTSPQKVQFVVRATGSYELQGKAISAVDLVRELQRLSGAGPLELQISVESRAEHQIVERAIAAVREAQIPHVSFRTIE